jgi:ribonuclease III
LNAAANDLPLESFLSKLEILPRDLRWYQEAFTHRSFLNETKSGGARSNERLEFLGDAVLGLLASSFLFKNFPKMHEGQMAKAKSSLVSENALARWAKELGLGARLVLGKGEEKSGGREKDALLADCFEALLGAIYLDLGPEKTAEFLERFLRREQEPGQAVEGNDAKTRLQEWAQSFFKQPPRYQVVKMTGPDHDRKFEIEVSVQEKVLALGKGKNKKEAEQSAAFSALRAIEEGEMKF